MSLKNIGSIIPDNSHQKIFMLKDNFIILLDHLNYGTMLIEEKEQILLIPKNPEAIAVAEQTKNINIANAILKYNHYSLKGNLEEKRNILIAIANEYDTFLHKRLDGFNNEFNMATFLINNCHIRHNNKSGKDKIEYISNLKDEELENLYDEIYQLILFCILSERNNARMKKFIEETKPLITNNKK